MPSARRRVPCRASGRARRALARTGPAAVAATGRTGARGSRGAASRCRPRTPRACDARTGDDDARRRADLRARRRPARRRRRARATRARRCARADARRRRGVRLHGHDRGDAAGAHRASAAARSRADLAATRPSGEAPGERRSAAAASSPARGLSGVPETLARYDPAGWPGALLAALGAAGGDGHTTNLTVVDADGQRLCPDDESRARLGRLAARARPASEQHARRGRLVREPLEPGGRMPSMMAPTFVFDGDGLELAIGAAGGTRLRTALVGVLGAILGEGLEPQAAVDRPRFHPAGDVVNAEPGVDEAGSRRSKTRAGRCGGGRRATTTSAASAPSGAAGAAADPRRSGAVRSRRSESRAWSRDSCTGGRAARRWPRTQRSPRSASSTAGADRARAGADRSRVPGSEPARRRADARRRRLVLTESAAILLYLADRYPEARLAPEDRTQFYRWLVFLTNTVQMTMLRFFYPERYGGDGVGEVAAAEAARHFALLDDAVDGPRVARGRAAHRRSTSSSSWSRAGAGDSHRRRGERPHLRAHFVRTSRAAGRPARCSPNRASTSRTSQPSPPKDAGARPGV